jgi:hypothetical protein
MFMDRLDLKALWRAKFDGKHTADLDTVAENVAEICIEAFDQFWPFLSSEAKSIRSAIHQSG